MVTAGPHCEVVCFSGCDAGGPDYRTVIGDFYGQRCTLQEVGFVEIPQSGADDYIVITPAEHAAEIPGGYGIDGGFLEGIPEQSADSQLAAGDLGLQVPVGCEGP